MIEKRKKRKKIFYVPGMISLILIPLFCFYHFYKVNAFQSYSSLEFSVPDKEDFEKYKVADLRKYRVFSFNDKKSKQKQKLNELRFFARDMVKKYDTINGAKIQFGSKTDYDTFVSVINIMIEENMPTWGLFNDHEIYALGNAKPKLNRKRSFICGTSTYSKENTIRMQEENGRKELQIFQVSFFNEQWIIFLGYLGLVLLNIFTLLNLNKNK
ncbi:hypothetical protein AB9T88_03815 [Flavobacterium sp. LBUM151]